MTYTVSGGALNSTQTKFRPWLVGLLTDAGRDGRPALLVTARAAVTRQPGDAVLARALAARLVARLVQRTHRMTVARYRHHARTHATTAVTTTP